MAEEEKQEETTEPTEQAPEAEETPAEEPVAEETPAEEVTESAAEPAATPEPEPDDTAGEGEDVGGDVPAAPSAPKPDDAAAEGEDVGGVIPSAEGEDVGGVIPEEPVAAAKPAPAVEEPAARQTPKATRKLKRSTHTGEARQPLSNEERAAERIERRKAKALSRRRARARTRERRGAERGEGTPAREPAPGKGKVRQGTVVSAKPDKTITVRVEITRRHPTYEKVVRKSNTVHAHDESNEAHEGDVVRVVESRPLSRLKRWRLLEIVERAR